MGSLYTLTAVSDLTPLRKCSWRILNKIQNLGSEKNLKNHNMGEALILN